MQNSNYNVSVDVHKQTSYEAIGSYQRNQFLVQLMDKALRSADTFLDIGCAKGEMIYYLKTKYPHLKFTGLEYSQALVDMASKEDFLKDVKFYQGDAIDFKLNQEFDVTLLSGVLAIFDDYEALIKNMLLHTKSGGKCYILEGFNKDDIDVMVRFRNNAEGSSSWECGWNMFSLNTISKLLAPLTSSVQIYPFKFEGKLEKKSNPVTSYSIRTETGENILLTGGNVRRDFYVVEFTKK